MLKSGTNSPAFSDSCAIVAKKLQLALISDAIRSQYHREMRIASASVVAVAGNDPIDGSPGAGESPRPVRRGSAWIMLGVPPRSRSAHVVQFRAVAIEQRP